MWTFAIQRTCVQVPRISDAGLLSEECDSTDAINVDSSSTPKSQSGGRVPSPNGAAQSSADSDQISQADSGLARVQHAEQRALDALAAQQAFDVVASTADRNFREHCAMTVKKVPGSGSVSGRTNAVRRCSLSHVFEPRCVSVRGRKVRQCVWFRCAFARLVTCMTLDLGISTIGWMCT